MTPSEPIEIHEATRTMWLDTNALFQCPPVEEITKIISAYFEEQESVKKKAKVPLAVIVCGLPGSGKSTVLEGDVLRQSIKGYDNCVVLDSALLEEASSPKGVLVPPVKNVKKAGGKKTGGKHTVPTGWRIRAKSAFAGCAELGDELYDSCVDRLIKEKKSFAMHVHTALAERLVDYRDKGYQTVIVRLETKPETAIRRAKKRALTNGLFFSDSFYNEYGEEYETLKKRFSGYAHLADAWVVVDNNGKKPIVDSFSSRKKGLVRT